MQIIIDIYYHGAKIDSRQVDIKRHAQNGYVVSIDLALSTRKRERSGPPFKSSSKSGSKANAKTSDRCTSTPNQAGSP